MGIHYDYKSKRGERAMLKEAKRKERLALRKAKRASTIPAKEPEQEMHDINKPKRKMSSIKGKVKWFNGSKGYGFIERDDKQKDVFVHMSAVKDAGIDYLDEGDVLTFDIEDGKKGPSAVNLKKV